MINFPMPTGMSAILGNAGFPTGISGWLALKPDVESAKNGPEPTGMSALQTVSCSRAVWLFLMPKFHLAIGGSMR
jgi:hypothetical protein